MFAAVERALREGSGTGVMDGKNAPLELNGDLEMAMENCGEIRGQLVLTSSPPVWPQED